MDTLKFNEILSGSVSFGQTYFANDLRENIFEISLQAIES